MKNFLKKKERNLSNSDLLIGKKRWCLLLNEMAFWNDKKDKNTRPF